MTTIHENLESPAESALHGGSPGHSSPPSSERFTRSSFHKWSRPQEQQGDTPGMAHSQESIRQQREEMLRSL